MMKQRILEIYMEEIYNFFNKTTENILKVAEDEKTYNFDNVVFSRSVSRFKAISERILNIVERFEILKENIKIINKGD